MRRLAITFLMIGSALGSIGVASASAQSTDDTSGDETIGDETAVDPRADRDEIDLGLPPVDVLQISGLVDEVVAREIDEAIARAEEGDSQALILQINSRAAVVSRDTMQDLYRRVRDAAVPIAVWVGPSGARATGTIAQLLSAADATGMAPGTRIGRTGVPLFDDVDFGEATDFLRSGTLGFQDARRQGAL
ncbi:MAG: hypothetical protein ACO3IN_12460, partial [Steroidobacteraceae bacterium]